MTQNKQENTIQTKQYKHIKSAIYTVMVAFFIFGTIFGLILKKNTDDIFLKDLKISTLINELGEVKESMDSNQQTVTNLFDELSTTKNTLSEINTTLVKSIQDKETNWVSIESDLYKTQDQLNLLLQEKEETINSLSSTNNQLNTQLNEELNKIEYDPNITDILILGENGSLVDTMILASANPYTNKMSLFSLPRDLYYKGRKINELYNYYGIEELKKAVYETTGIKADKYVLFDFESFITLIDELGGIEINVEKDLYDKSYPGANYSYSVVSFKAGLQEMDGSTALQYARSRKSTSDFDRSYRQQQVINSVKSKVLKLDLLAKMDLATRVYASIKENIKTDISFFESLDYLQKFKEFELKGGNVLSTGNYLYSTHNARGQYILLPQGGNYAEVQKFIQDLVTT